MRDIKHSYNWSERSVETYTVRGNGIFAMGNTTLKNMRKALVSSRGYSLKNR